MPDSVSWKGLPAWALVEARVTRSPDGVVRVPYFNGDGTLHASRVFAANGRCWWDPAGAGVKLYGLEQLSDVISAGSRALLLAEGESDALALRATYGLSVGDDVAAGYDVLGVPGASTWRRSWTRYLARYAVVYVVGDGDEAGERFAWTVRRDFPSVRIVPIPTAEDARSILQGDNGVERLGALLDRADADAALTRAFRDCRTLDEARAMLRSPQVERAAA